MRRLFAALALAAVLACLGTTHLAPQHSSPLADGSPTTVCNGTPGPC
ncbi:MAG TPA: hypothetical protein VGR88_06695 [Ktedonobacterales bacterium]|nr:hypothetical protein [Ktedonobacterales bacterium]